MSETKKDSSGEGFVPVDFNPFEDGELQLVVPSTEAQKEIWLSAQFDSNANCAFNESMSFQIQGSFNPIVFQECILDVIQRHDALRVTFSTDGSTLGIAAELKIDIPIIDLTDESNGGHVALNGQIANEVTQPFDLSRGPLVRAKILKLGEQNYHVLFTSHHIICDGWSMAIIIQDLQHLYHAKISGVTPQLPPPYRFSEYAIEDNQQFAGDQGRDAERFWLSLYSHEVPVLDIPTDRKRPLMRTFNAARVDYSINPEIVKQLKKTGAKYGCTFTITLIAAFKTYLYRLTSQESIVLGMPAAGQLAAGKEHLVGHCVNLLPLVSRIEVSQEFCDYLISIRNLMFDANQHQRYTFGSLIQKLELPRDPGRIPLIPIIFNIDQKTWKDDRKIEGVDFNVVTNHRKFENFELFFNLASSSKGHKVVMECTYNVNLFDEKTICLRLAEFEALLESIVDSPEQLLSTISCLPEFERQQVITEFNNTQTDYPKGKCFHHIFEQQVEFNPDRVAVEFQGDRISYGDLNRKANMLAHYLIERGIGPDVLAGLFVDRSIDMMIGLLGILKAGGAYLPLDPNYPKERLAYMLEESGASVLLAREKFRNDLPASGSKVVFIDSDWHTIGQMNPENPVYHSTAGGPGPENLAYVIYTSGSTGKPKGVKIPHRAVTNFLTSMSREPGMTSDDILLALTTLSFDIHILELYLPLIVGGKVVIASSDTAADGIELADMLTKTGATIMQATPVTWRLMISSGWEGSEALKVLCGGEAFPEDLRSELLNRAGSVWNMYGPTETTVWSTCYRITDPERPVLIGRPIANTQVFVLDKNMQPVPIGVPGELYIGGDGVTNGYHNRPDLTAEAFVQNPFVQEFPGQIIYKTGDLCRFHADGNLEYLNRIDTQVKVRGYRIELGEIESRLKTHESVTQAVVIVKALGPGDVRLAAYVVPTDGHEIIGTELRRHLRRYLPDYMLPQHFIEEQKLPLTPAGKIDRKKLESQFEIGGRGEEKIIEPSSESEKYLTDIWKEMLETNFVSTHHNFFNIGGHSLLAMRVIGKVAQDTGIRISPRDMLLNTLAQIAFQYDFTQTALQDKSAESSGFFRSIKNKFKQIQ